MFGPDLLVSPVLDGTCHVACSLPALREPVGTTSGPESEPRAAQASRSPAPLDRIPLDVRAGSILPLGPVIEYAGQATDPIELRVYPGADGDFTLYEDEGDSYRYEQGAHATIPDPLGRCDANAHLRRTPGQLSRHAIAGTLSMW